MKQLYGFCALSFVVVIIVTVIAVFITVQEIQNGDFLQQVAEQQQDQLVDESIEAIQPPQLGLNFIRFFWETETPGLLAPKVEPWSKPVVIFDDFEELGVDAYRQFIKADLLWNVVEPLDDEWDFEYADQVIPNADFEPIVTLFSLQYASGTPPWASGPEEFQRELGPEAKDYLATVIDRYGEHVKYWEIGNEMDHWRAADPLPEGQEPATQPQQAEPPPIMPEGGYTPDEQGVFLAQVAEFIRERDEDAVIVMPGMGGLSSYTLDTWLAGVLAGGGSDWFDIVNYHHYGDWHGYSGQRDVLEAFLVIHELEEKPVWLTETGATASPTLMLRTDYPNSPASQAADVFRRIIQAFGHGDDFVAWHTYVGSPNMPDNAWRLYGLRDSEGQKMPSYDAFKLLSDELIPFESVELLSQAITGVNAYRVATEEGEEKYVVWGEGVYQIPEGVSEMVSVVPPQTGVYVWQPIPVDGVLQLTDVPVLLK